jgi:hypothetical protein
LLHFNVHSLAGGLGRLRWEWGYKHGFHFLMAETAKPHHKGVWLKRREEPMAKFTIHHLTTDPNT